MKRKKNKTHYFLSPTGHLFYGSKVESGLWFFAGNKTNIIRYYEDFKALKKNVLKVYGFDYVGFM